MIRARLLHDYAIINLRSLHSNFKSIKPLFYRKCFNIPTFCETALLNQANDWMFQEDGPYRTLKIQNSHVGICDPKACDKDLPVNNFGYILSGDGSLTLTRKVSWVNGIDGAPEFIFKAVPWGEDIWTTEPGASDDDREIFGIAASRSVNTLESVIDAVEAYGRVAYDNNNCCIVNLKHIVECLNGTRSVNNVECVYMLEHQLKYQDLCVTRLNQPTNSKGSKAK